MADFQFFTIIGNIKLLLFLCRYVYHCNSQSVSLGFLQTISHLHVTMEQNQCSEYYYVQHMKYLETFTKIDISVGS